MLVPTTDISAKVIAATVRFLRSLLAVGLFFTRESFFDIASPSKTHTFP
jgi:hypothetical protein